MTKKKTDKNDAPTDAPAKVKSMIFVTYFGLDASPLQRKGLDDRHDGLQASLLNGWVQDGKGPTGRVTAKDIELRSARGQAAVAEAKRQADVHIEAYAAHTLPPLVVGEILVRGGVSAIIPADWAALQANPVLTKMETIKGGRLLGPDKTAELVSTKDQAILVDLVSRTHCSVGLAWLHGREVARKNSRARVLDACAAKAKRMGITLDAKPRAHPEA